MTKHQLARLSVKLHRLAYELEHDAWRLSEADLSYYADSIKAVSSSLGKLASAMGREALL